MRQAESDSGDVIPGRQAAYSQEKDRNGSERSNGCEEFVESRSQAQSEEQKAEEARLIRRMQLMMNIVMQVIQQDRSLPVEQASEMVADARRAALAMFPDKALAFDLIFWPRLQRLMRERYRMQ